MRGGLRYSLDPYLRPRIVKYAERRGIIVNGSAGFGKRVTCQISRNGDLINRIYLQVTLPAPGSGVEYVDYVGLRLLKGVEIEIGGQRIDKHYSDWMYVWNELSLAKGKRDGWNTMVGADLAANTGATLYVPLEFWFCRNVGLALPLIALIARAEKRHPCGMWDLPHDKLIYGPTAVNSASKMLVACC